MTWNHNCLALTLVKIWLDKVCSSFIMNVELALSSSLKMPSSPEDFFVFSMWMPMAIMAYGCEVWDPFIAPKRPRFDMLTWLIHSYICMYSSIFTNFRFIGERSYTPTTESVRQWTEILDRGSCVDVMYCDFVKAFDIVPHGRLIQFLHYYGIDVMIINWVLGSKWICH